MRQSVLMIAGIVLLTAIFGYAQDPDDPGMADSLIIGFVDVDFNPGQDTYIDVPVYFVTDDSIASVMLPIECTSSDGNISIVSVTWNDVLENWEDTYNSDDFTWLVGFRDLGDEPDAPLLYTNHARVEALTIEFRIAAAAEEQLVWIRIGEGPYDLPVNLGLVTATDDKDITPVVVPGYIRYGAVGIDDDVAALPTEYAVKQNYPNPFNPETNFEYQLPQAGHVSIEIYNILGQNVRTLLSENKEAGVYTAHWDGANNDGSIVPSGIYFYRVTTGDFSSVKKMIMIK